MKEIHILPILVLQLFLLEKNELSRSQVKEVSLCPWLCYMLHILYRETQHCDAETELQLSSAELLRG